MNIPPCVHTNLGAECRQGRTSHAQATTAQLHARLAATTPPPQSSVAATAQEIRFDPIDLTRAVEWVRRASSTSKAAATVARRGENVRGAQTCAERPRRPLRCLHCPWRWQRRRLAPSPCMYPCASTIYSAIASVDGDLSRAQANA